MVFLVAQCSRIHLPMEETWTQSPGHEDPLEKEMETHSSILAWEIPCTEEPGGLQPLGHRVRHDLVTKQQNITCNRMLSRTFSVIL